MGYRNTVDINDLNPVLVWGQRFLVVVLFLISGLALMTDRYFPDSLAGLRTQTTDVLAPLVNATGAPVRWIKRGARSVNSFIDQSEQVARAESLAAELDHARLEIARRDALIEELRSNINLPPDGLEDYLSARVLLVGNSLFSTSLVLNVGAQHGTARAPLRPGLAVITRRGILGRLQSVGNNSSRVRLITAQGSALPVLVGQFRVRGTVLGNDTNIMTLVTEEALPGTIALGDLVLTSTIDPDIPYLFTVGTVVGLTPDMQVRPTAIDADGIDGIVQLALKPQLDQAVQ